MGPPAGGSGGSVEPPLPSLLARVHAAFWALDEAAGMDVQASAGTAQLLRNGVDGADLAAASSTDPTSVDAGAPAPAPCARLVQNRRLTAEDHWQEVRHLDFELAGEQYEPGDVLSVLPQQDWQAVCEVLTVSARRVPESGGRGRLAQSCGPPVPCAGRVARSRP